MGGPRRRSGIFRRGHRIYAPPVYSARGDHDQQLLLPLELVEEVGVWAGQVAHELPKEVELTIRVAAAPHQLLRDADLAAVSHLH